MSQGGYWGAKVWPTWCHRECHHGVINKGKGGGFKRGKWKCSFGNAHGAAKVGRGRVPREEIPKGNFRGGSQGGVLVRENARGEGKKVSMIITK